jgi:hypothetical protein
MAETSVLDRKRTVKPDNYYKILYLLALFDKAGLKGTIKKLVSIRPYKDGLHISYREISSTESVSCYRKAA